MAKKRTGCGTILNLDEAGGTSYTPVSLVAELTLPGMAWNEVDAPELDKCTNYTIPGSESTPSEFSFVQYWEPGDTDHERIDTLQENKGTGGFQAELPFDYAVTQPTVEWQGWIREIGPETITNDGVIQRTVTGVRTSTITRNAGSDT